MRQLEVIENEIDKIDYYTPIFFKKNGKLAGMLIHEFNGWIIRIGKGGGSSGFYDSQFDCILAGIKNGYECYVDDDR